MTDNLRTRITAALKDVDDMRVCKLSDADIRFMADAVICELGIRPEWGLLDDTDSGLICDTFEEAKSRKALPGESLHTRLVTDWVHVPQG